MRPVLRGFRRAGAPLFLLSALIAATPASADDAASQQTTLTGDWGGARSDLASHGVDIGLDYVGEIFGNASGGLKQGMAYEGRATLSLDFDLDKLANWSGASAHASGLYIHHYKGMPAADYVGSIGDPSNIEARHATRLFTLWLQQELFDGKVSLRLGQLAADDEFLLSDAAGNLINGAFGWAPIASANMTSGGPAYPLATPGVRLRVEPTSDLSFLVAAFSADPAGRNCFDDPQICNRHGTTFSMSGGTLWMGEVQYAVNQGENAKGLPGVYKLGGWSENGSFADQRFGVDALGAVVPLALASDGLDRRGNQGIYAIADQTVWKSDVSAQSANLFLRLGGAPSDRNLVSFYVDGGVGFSGLVPGRDEDVLTFGVAYSKISKDAIDADRDTQIVNADPAFPVRNAEGIIELAYLAPWLSVQPDLQYIIRPGGNVPHPNNAVETVDNALFMALRTSVTF